MINAKKYAVYYRDIPAVLSKFIDKDGMITLVKDGVNTGVGHACPRMTLIVNPTNIANKDKERIKKLEEMLDRLCQNNQLVSYS